MIKIWGKKTNFLVHFESFLYFVVHSMSYAQKICQSVVSFISIAFVVGKLKIFKFICIDSAFMKCPLLGFFLALIPPSQILFSLAEILTKGSL